MNAVNAYLKLVRKNLDKPTIAYKFIKYGLNVAEKYVSFFPDRRLPESLRSLSKLCFKYIRAPIDNPQNAVWVNVFAPTEFLHAMDIYPLFIEAYSSYMSGFCVEDCLIDKAESAGISNTLCSYHKAFIGSGELGILPKPKMAVTTSMVCDANINTFRYLAAKFDIPIYIIDIPYEYNRNTVEYVKGQLLEMIGLIEGVFNKKLDLDRLREIISLENRTRKLIKEYINNLKYKSFNTTMATEMYMLFTSHVFMGLEETFDFYERLVDDIKKAPDRSGKGIFFVHLLPMFEKSFKKYLNFSSEFQILGSDLNYDFLNEMYCPDPFEAIAEKMILNIYNGGFERRVKAVSNLVDEIKPDGIIQFCHWGCKQSIGGVGIYRNYFRERGIPFLAVDGDAIDKRNNQEGQIRTRLEAFLEMLKRR